VTARLPVPGSDDGSWGGILNDFLSVSLGTDGTLKTSAIQTAGGVTTSSVGSANGVAGLNGNGRVPLTQLGAGTASSSNFLRGDGIWAVPAGSGGSSTLAGDTDVSIVSPSNGQVLTYDGTIAQWQNVSLPTSLPPNGSASGDLSGSYPSPTVAKLSGVAVPGSAPSGAGQVLTSTGTSTTSWQAPTYNKQTVAVKSSAYSLTTNDEIVLANTSTGSFTLTLPTAIGNTNLYSVKKTDASTNTVTVATSSGQTIDGGATAVIKVQYACISIVSDGSNWYII
jgi:hypothetical protein